MTEQELSYFELGYIPEQYPWLFPSIYPDATPPPEQAPAASEPAQDTSPVISLDQLAQLLNELQTADEEQTPSDEQSSDEVPSDPGDTVAVELDADTWALIKAIKGVETELVQISDQLSDMQISGDRPLLTTSFSDYTVTEGLLLLLLLSVFLSACYKLLRGGFQWLRS